MPRLTRDAAEAAVRGVRVPVAATEPRGPGLLARLAAVLAVWRGRAVAR